MNNFSKIIRFSVITCLLVIFAASIPSLHAQEDVNQDDETLIPPSGVTTQPTILDESDSSGVSDVEEYEG